MNIGNPDTAIRCRSLKFAVSQIQISVNIMADEIIIRPSIPADAEMAGKLTHAIECELRLNKATSLDETRFITAARELLYTIRDFHVSFLS
jgi:hypothetical protein